jgi:hypothetical protein
MVEGKEKVQPNFAEATFCEEFPSMQVGMIRVGLGITVDYVDPVLIWWRIYFFGRWMPVVFLPQMKTSSALAV